MSKYYCTIQTIYVLTLNQGEDDLRLLRSSRKLM